MCESIGHLPIRGRCPAPSLNFNHNLLRQGTGTADHLTLLRLLRSLASLFLLKCSSDFKYGPCQPARDWDRRVSGRVSGLRFTVKKARLLRTCPLTNFTT